MSKWHRNTLRLIEIEDEALRLGWAEKYPRRSFSYEVAEEAGELGNEYPSDEAIRIAERKLEEFKKEVLQDEL